MLTRTNLLIHKIIIIQSARFKLTATLVMLIFSDWSHEICLGFPNYKQRKYSVTGHFQVGLIEMTRAIWVIFPALKRLLPSLTGAVAQLNINNNEILSPEWKCLKISDLRKLWRLVHVAELEQCRRHRPGQLQERIASLCSFVFAPAVFVAVFRWVFLTH